MNATARERVSAYCDAVLQHRHAITIDQAFPHLTNVIIDPGTPTLRLDDVIRTVTDASMEDSTDRILIYLTARDPRDTIDATYTPALTVSDLTETTFAAIAHHTR